jgi:hypothetical protein
VHFQVIGIVETGEVAPIFHLVGQPEVRVADLHARTREEAIALFERTAAENGERVIAVTGVGEGQ